MERTYRKLLGKNLPIKDFVSRRVDGFLPNHPSDAPPEFTEEVESRLDAWFEGCPRELHSDRDYLLVEDRRIRPTCYAVSVSGPLMYRTYPYDTFLADSRVAECYARIKAAWKLNGDVWGLAAGKICEGAGDIVDANYGWAVNAGTTAKLIGFTRGWLRRRVPIRRQCDRSTDGHPPSTASWPDFGWYAVHSNTLKSFWENTPGEHRQLLTRCAGTDPWSVSLEAWSHEAPRLFRILTLLQHLRNDQGLEAT